ncbi:hypothetical protein ColKHC_02183 [Colletotrichum higginsianum]|nr:hypothetical protein ColKHC_02183 [Colletotrichum higginsianum]
MAFSSRASGSANDAVGQSGYYTLENKAFDDEHDRQEYFQIAHYHGEAGNMQMTEKCKETNGQLIERFREQQGSFGVPMHHINVKIGKHPTLPLKLSDFDVNDIYVVGYKMGVSGKGRDAFALVNPDENGLCELAKEPRPRR